MSPDQWQKGGVSLEESFRKEDQMESPRTYVGNDVVKATLDLASYPSRVTDIRPHTDGIAALVKVLQAAAPALIVVEPQVAIEDLIRF